jgi:hypothetical protein
VVCGAGGARARAAVADGSRGEGAAPGATPGPAGTTHRGGGKVAYYAPTNFDFLENLRVASASEDTTAVRPALLDRECGYSANVRYRGHRGQWWILALIGSVENDPTAPLAVHSGSVSEAGFSP